MIDSIGKWRSNGQNATSLAQNLLWQPLNAKAIRTMTQCDSVLAGYSTLSLDNRFLAVQHRFELVAGRTGVLFVSPSCFKRFVLLSLSKCGKQRAIV